MQPSTEASAISAIAWPWRTRSGQAVDAAKARAARVSGVIQATVGLAVAALFHFWLHRERMAAVVTTLATLNGLIALLSPLGLYRRVTAAVGLLGRFIGQLVTWILMPPVFYLMFTVVGAMLRLGGKLRLTRRPDRTQTTYWRDLTANPRTPESYRRQF